MKSLKIGEKVFPTDKAADQYRYLAGKSWVLTKIVGEFAEIKCPCGPGIETRIVPLKLLR